MIPESYHKGTQALCGLDMKNWNCVDGTTLSSFLASGHS